MSKILSPSLSIEQIQKKFFINNFLNNEEQKIISNEDFLPSFDYYTDIKFLTTSNYINPFQTNSNPYGLSKLSLDKYKNLENNNSKIMPINQNKENMNKNFDDIKIKYKKINNNKKEFSDINKNKLQEIAQTKENLEIKNINYNLKVSNILNDTIGENNNSTNNKNESFLNNNDNLIDYLKKENEYLKKSNERNNQIINSLFYFINQLSQKYSPDKKVFDLSYYHSNLNKLSSDLSNLSELIQNQSIAQKENSINYNKINSSNKIEENGKDKKECIKKKAGQRQRKKNNEFIFDRTFTFGQNDSFNKGNKLCTSKKHNSFIKSNNENNKIKKINNYKNKKNNNIKILGCNIKGSNTSINKQDSKINLKDKNFNCIPNEKEAMRSVKKIIYD